MMTHQKHFSLKRSIAMLLVFCMVSGCAPAGFADDGTLQLATPTDLMPIEEIREPEAPADEPEPEEPLPDVQAGNPSADEQPAEELPAESAAGDTGEADTPDEAAGLCVLTTDPDNTVSVPNGEPRTISIQTGNYEISAYGVFPEGTVLQAAEIPMEAAEQMSGKGLQFAYDIRLVVDGQVWQPGEDVTISVKDLSGGMDGKDIQILHVRNDLMNEEGSLSDDALNNTLQDLEEGTAETEEIAAENGEDGVTFDTSSFSAFVASTASALQTLLDEAMKEQGDTLNEKITITLNKDTKYEGNLAINKGSYNIGDGFSVEIIAEDAGDDDLQAGGTTVLEGDISVAGIAVKLAGFLLGNGKKITAKDNAKVDFFGTAKNDTVMIDATNSTVNINTGDGDDTVTAAKTGGTMNIDTGDGKDTVTAETKENNSGDLTIATGEGEDSVTVTNNRGNVTVDTGDGDDTVKFTNKAAESTVGIATGTGNDTVELDVQAAGQGIEVNTGEGDDSVALTDSNGTGADSTGTVTVDTGKGINSVEVNLALAKAVNQLTVRSGEGNDHLHITGALKEISGDSTNASGTLANFTLTEKDGKTLNFLLPDGIEGLTDDLQNKRTVKLTPVATGTNAGSLTYNEAESFTNYVINAPSSSLKNITVTAKQGLTPILSNVVINTDTTTDGDNKLVVKNGTTIAAPDLTLVLKARNIEINGLLKAGQIQIEALDGTGMYRRNFKDQYNAYMSEQYRTPIDSAIEAGVDMLWDMVNIKDKATITIGETGEVYATGDVIMLARVEQSGSMLDLGSTFTTLLDTLADQVNAGTSATSVLNAVNVKVGEAKIDIRGKVKAGVTDFSTLAVEDGHGTVRANAEVKISEGYDSKDKLIDGIPVSVSVAYGDASVQVAKSAVIEAARDISLASKTEMKIGSRADSGLFGAPFAAAISVVVDSATTTVEGELKAHSGDVRVAADANADVRTLADKGNGQKVLSGGYLSVAVVLQDAKAALKDTAKVTAGGKVRVESRANEKVDTNATSAQVASEKEADKDDSTAGNVKNTILDTLKEKLWPKIKEAMKSSPTAQEKMEQAMKKVSSESHNSMLDDESGKHGDVTVIDNTTDGQSTTYRVKVTPWAGYKVKSVTWRGYNPGGTSYLTGTASKNDENNYTVTPIADGTAVATVIIHVEYEEDTDYEEPTAADLFDEKEGSDDVDLQALIDDLNNSTDDTDNTKATDSEDDENEFVDLKLEGVLTWETENDGKTCQKQTFAGDKIQILPNPPAGKKLKEGGIKVKCNVKGEDGKSTQKVTTLQPDSKGRYFYTMPDNLMTGKTYSVVVTAEFEDAGTEDKKADENTTEVVGAIAVTVADNDSTAVIESGATVISGGKTEVVSETATNVTNTADGSPAGKPEGASGDGEKKENNEGTAIKRLEEETKTRSDGNGRAKYGLIADETINGAITGITKVTADTENKQNYDYKFTVSPATSDGAYAYQVAKVVLVYISGGEQKTKELTAGNDGYYSFDLADGDLAMDEGTTAHITATFAQDGRYGQTDTTSAQQNVLENPIQISFNTLKDEPSTATDPGYAGHIYYKGKDTNGYRFEVTAATAKGYTLEGGKLTAKWKDASGAEQTKELTMTDGAWYLNPADIEGGIPAGAQIVVSGKFVDDLHDLKKDANTDSNGEVKLYDTKVKVTDKPQITVKPKDGYSLTEITVTYKKAGTNTTATLTLSGGGVTKVDGKDTLYTFTLADQLAAGSEVTVKAEYTLKSIGIYAGPQDKDDKGENAIYSLSAKNAAAGDTITVTLTDKNAKAGKKISKITVTGGEVEVTGNSFKIKDGTTGPLTVTVELTDKAIALSETKLENGTVKPAAAKADWNDTVTVTITPADNYKVKQGSLKAIVRAKDGSSTDEIYLSRKNDTTYTFQMPSQNGRIASNIEVSFTGEFEPGESDSSTLETSLGAAISVNVTNSESRAEIKGKVTAGSAVNVSSAANGSAKTESKAGYSKGNVGIGGAVSVQVASMDSKALVHQGAQIKLDGQLSVDSKSELTFTVNADASGSKKEAKKAGVGAGIAVAVNGGDTFAAVQDGASISANTKDAIKGISVTANQKVKDTVTAKAGAAGGTAVVPVASVDVSGAQAEAYMGKVFNGKLKMTEGMTVSATSNGEHTVSADASAAGKGTGVGASIVVTVIADKANAKLNQSVEAEKVTVSAETTSKVEGTATASASGGKKEEDNKGKDPDKQADGLIGGAAKLAGKNKSSGVSGGGIMDSTKDRQKSETSEGTVGVAGALVVNVQNSASVAEIQNGVNIKASDLIAVTALNGTTSKIKANGSTTNSDKGVGVGIAINIINLDNIARMGDGEFEAAMLKVAAETKMTDPEKKEEKKKEEKTNTEDKLEKDLGEKAGEFINYLVKETGLDQYVSEDLLGEIIAPVVTAATKELIKASGIKEYIGDGTISELYEANKAKLSDAWESLKQLPEQLLEPLMEAMEILDEVENLDADQIQALAEKILSEFGKQLVNKLESAGKKILEEFKEGMIKYLKDNAGDIFSGAISNGLTDAGSKIFDEAKKVITESVKKELKSFIGDVITDTLLNAGVPFLDQQNIDRVTKAFNSLKDAYERESLDKIFSNAADFVTEKVRAVFDYEAMVTKLAKTDFKKTITDGLRNAAKAAQVTLGNELLNAMSNHFGLKITPEEEKATGHVIITQAIAGAGARKVGVAGSVAITVLNGETTAKIADGGKITVSQGMTVNADETRTVKNAASAAANANGDADDNKKEANKGKDVGGGNDAGTRANGLHVSMETAPGASLSIRQGDKAQDKPKIYITVKDGYKLPEKNGKPYASYTYKDEDGNEKTGTIEISKSAEGEYYVDPKVGDLAALDSDKDVTLKLVPEEVLRKIGKPDLMTDGNVEVEAGAVSVEVKDREPEKDDNGNEFLQAREGETVKITIARKEGRKVTGVGYSWKDADGKTHDVELNGTSIGKAGADKAFTLVSSNKDEYIYSITMPAGEITDIVVVFEAGKEDGADDSETSAKDEDGKTVGVGAAFSIVYGGTEVNALVGKREINAGDIGVTAATTHKEDVSAAAGTDPVGEKTDEDDIKDVGVDASIALNILDNEIKAAISAGSDITTTGYTTGEGDAQVTKDGDLTVTAKEDSTTETTSSAFAVGGKTAVGATVAVNIAITEVTAEMAGTANITGSAAIAGSSHSEDTTKAMATAMGADIARNLNKLNEKAENLEEKTNKLLDGSYIDKIGKDDKKSTETNDRINKRLDSKKQEKGKETSNKNSTSSNILRSLGVTAQGNDAGSEGTTEATSQIKKTTDQDIDVGSSIGGDGEKKEKNWQVAAAVGVTVADHEVRTNTGAINAGKGIAVSAENSGNFNTTGTGAAMSMAKRANSIAAGVAVSINDNQAKVKASGDLTAGEDLSVTSKVTQNLDGDFAGKLAVQSLSGSVAGNNSSISLGGAISVLVSTAESTVEITGGSETAKRKLEGKNITVEATDKSRLGARAGGLSISKGSTVGMGIASSNVISENIVTATVGNNTEITGNSFKLNAEKLAVTAEDLKLLDWSYLITDSSDLSDEQRKEADTGLIDMHKGDDDESYKVDVNLSSDKLLQAFDALNFLSGQNTYVEAIAGSVMTQAKREEDSNNGENGSKLSLAGSFAVAVTNNTIGAKLGSNTHVNITKDDTHTGDVTVNAANGATTRIIAGSMSASPAKASVGATVAVLVTGDEVTAETGADTEIDADGDVTHNAETKADIQLFTAAVSVAAGTQAEKAAGGALNVIVSRNKAENKTGTGTQVTSGGTAAFTAKAVHDMMAISAAGNVTASSSKESTYAAGGTVNVIIDKTQALNTLNLKKVTAENNVEIAADVEDELISGTAALSAAVGKDSKAGAGVVNLIVSNSNADSTVAGETDITATSGSLLARARNDALLVNASASAAGAKETAVGLSFNVNIINRKAKVNLASGSLTAGEDIAVQAEGRDTDVMAGLAVSGSVKGSAGSGNFIVAYESNEIGTKITDKINATAGRNAVFESYFSDFTVGAGGNVAVSTNGKSFGATVLTIIKDNDIATEMGSSTVTADAAGGTATKTLNGGEVSGVHIGAEAQETQYFVAAGVAGSNDLAANGEVVVLVNNNTVLADASKAELNALLNKGSVNVSARDKTHQLLLAGGLSISASSSAIGAAVVTLVSNKTIDAKAHDMHADKDVNVTADNKDDIAMFAVSAGGGGGSAIEIGAAVQVLKSHARATVGSDVTAQKGSFNLKAANNTKLLNVAGAAAGASGGAAAAPVAAITYFQGEANAVLLPGSTVNVTAGDINITTESNKDVKLITIGISAGSSLGLSGAANVLVSKDKAYAGVKSETEPEYKDAEYAKSVLTTPSGSVKINAQNDYKLRAISGAIGAGSAAIGVNAVVSVLKSQTVAELGGDATAGKNVDVTANGKRDVINAAATLAAGSFGGGITVMVLVAGTKMSQDAADMIARGNGDSKDKKTGFDASLFMDNAAKAGINFNLINANETDEDRKLNASILEDDIAGNGHNESTETVGHKEKNEEGEEENTFDGATGYRSSEIDTLDNDDANEGNRGENLEAKDTEDVDKAKNMNTYTYDSDELPEDAVIARILGGETISANTVNVEASQAVAADMIGASVGVGTVGGGISTVVAILHSNVVASSMANIVKAAGGVNVKAESKAGHLSEDGDADKRDNTVLDLMSNKPVTEDATQEEKDKAAEEKKSTWEELKDKVSNRAIRAFSVAVGAGTVGLGVAVSVVLTDNVTEAILGGEVGTENGVGEVNVSAKHDYGTVMAATGSLAVGVAAAGVSVSVAQANGTVKALIADDASVKTKADKDINVASDSKVGVDSIAITAGGGYAAINAAVALSFNRLTQETGIGGGTTIQSGRDINVGAKSNTSGNNFLLGISFGLGAASLNAAVTNVSADIDTHIGSDSKASTITAARDIKVNNDTTSKAIPKVISVAAGGVAVAGNILLAFNDTMAAAAVRNSTVNARNLSVLGDLAGEATSKLATAQIGGVAVGLSVNYADLHAENRAAVTDSALTLSGDLNIRTGAGENNTTSATADTISASMGAITVGINAAIARNNTKNYAILTGTKKVSVDGNMTVHGAGNSSANASVYGLDIGLASVAVSAVIALNDADARTKVELKDTDVKGTANFDATQKATTDAKMHSGGGSLLSLKVSAAIAYGKAQSIVDVNIKGKSNFGDIKSLNDAEDKVSANVENASFSAISAAARFAAAYSQDLFDSTIIVSGATSEIGSVDVKTDYTMTSDAVVTPSTCGVDVSLGSLAVNAAIAKNTARAGAAFEAIQGSAHVSGDVKVLTDGTVTTNANIRTADISVGGISLGANIAKADLSVIQEAHLRVGGTLNVDGAADVQSIANTATANAVIAAMGGEQGLDVKLANLDVSKAIARENMQNSAVVLGGPVAEVMEEQKVDHGQYVTKKSGHFDYELVVDGLYIVRDENGVALREEGTMITYNTGDWEFLNKEGDVVKSKMDPANDGKRKVKSRKPKEDVMMRFGDHYEWIEEEIEVWEPNIVKEYYPVKVYNADENNLHAASLNIAASTAEGTITGATASTNGPMTIGLVSAGSLAAKAISSDTFSVVFEGMTATITGDATLKASTGTTSYAEGTTPGGFSAYESYSSDVTSQVGERGDRQTVAVVIGKGNTLVAKNIDITAENTGAAKAHLDMGTTGSLATIKKTTQPTESWYNTLVSIGRDATLEATNGDITITSSDAPSAESKISTTSISLTLNFNSTMGKNSIDQENNLDIGSKAIVKAVNGSVNLNTRQLTNATSETIMNGGSVLEGSTAKAQNDIYRVARINVDTDADISGKYVTLKTVSGEGDKISTNAYVGSYGLGALGEAKAYNNMEAHAEIVVAEGVKLTGSNSLILEAIATSYNDKNTPNRFGVENKASVDCAGLAILPQSVARNNISMTAFIDINKDPTEGKANNRRKAVLTSENGDVLVNSSNESMSLYAYANSVAKGLAGKSNANAWNAATLTNAVWIDDATITGKNIRIYADNGGTLKDQNESHKPYIKSYANAKLSAIGNVAPDARITGEMVNQIRSYNTKNVTFTANGGEVIHKTSVPYNVIRQDATANAEIKKILGIPLAKNSSVKVIEWGYHNRCDFCGEGDAYDVERTRQTTVEKRYEDAFEKALSPINDIIRAVAAAGITKARYGEEDLQAAGKIYVLELRSMLENDVQLSQDKVKSYRLWNNTQTYLNAYLMPNAARLYTNATGRFQFVTDVISGDVFGEEWSPYIELVSALTANAVRNPVIPIGSTGSLDLSSGILTLPDLADYELYLEEVSAAWMKECMETGYMRILTADPEAVNACAQEGGNLPAGKIAEGLTLADETDGWKAYWAGDTPETAEDPDQPLYLLLINEETDEVDAFRTSVNMLENNEMVDVSLYLYRDSKSDRAGEERYNVMMFDTTQGEKSIVKAVTNVLADRKLEMPRPLRIVLRGRMLEGADKPVYCLNGHVFILCDVTDGSADVLGGYHVTFDGDTFESNYTKIEGISSGELTVTIKEGQPVWPEWTGRDSAEDIDGTRFQRENGEWYRLIPAEEPVQAQTDNNSASRE